MKEHEWTDQMDNRNLLDKYKGLSNEEIKADLDKNKYPVDVLLCNISDWGNCGTIIRNCNAFGVSKVLLYGRRKYDRRSTVGTHKYMAIEHYREPTEILSVMEKYETIAVENDSFLFPMPYTSYIRRDTKKKLLFIFGGEAEGIPKFITDKVDSVIYIPQIGSVRSINVGVASGIILANLKNMI